MIWLFVASVAAQTTVALAPYPEVRQPVQGQCASPVGIDVGVRVPVSLVSDGVGQCAGTVLPVSQALDLAAIESWSIACADQYDVVTSGVWTDLANVTSDLAAVKAENASLRRRAKPVLHLVLGAGSTLVLVGGGVAIGLAI